MAPHYSSLPNDWRDLGLEPSNEVPTLNDAHSTRLDDPAQQFLDAPFIANPYLGSSDARLVAFRNNLQDDRTHSRYRSQSARYFSGGDAYDVSEQRSDPTHATALQDLQPPCPISVESDLRCNSAWVGSSSHSIADPSNFSRPTGTSSNNQYLDPPTYDPSLVQLDNSSFDDFSEHLPPGPLPSFEQPWYPGSRVCPPNCQGEFTRLT
jgi:hypothetical protein